MAILNFQANRGPYAIGSTVTNVRAPTREVELYANQVWELGGDHRWRVLLCLQGELWVTQEGDGRDYLLAAGQMFIVTRPGLVVVQALQPARVQITSPVANRAQW